MAMTSDQRLEIRSRVVAATVLGLESIPLDWRRAAALKAIETAVNQIIREMPLVTADDVRAIFVTDFGAGPIGTEIADALADLESGVGAIDGQALAALAKGTRRPGPSDKP